MPPLNPVTHPEHQASLEGHGFLFVYIPPGETIRLGIRRALYVGVTQGRIWHLVFMYHKAITGESSPLLSARIIESAFFYPRQPGFMG